MSAHSSATSPLKMYFAVWIALLFGTGLTVFAATLDLGRYNAAVALGIGLFAVGLALSFVGRIRQANEMAACQNNLRTLHQGLSGYADTQDGRFPQVLPRL